MELKESNFKILGTSSKDYNFEEVLNYIKENEIEVLFYKVDEKLTVDLTKEPKLKQTLLILEETNRKVIISITLGGFSPCFVKDGEVFFFRV